MTKKPADLEPEEAEKITSLAEEVAHIAMMKTQEYGLDFTAAITALAAATAYSIALINHVAPQSPEVLQGISKDAINTLVSTLHRNGFNDQKADGSPSATIFRGHGTPQ